MIGTVERDEAPRVPGSLEDLACVVDVDDLVDGRVEDQQRSTQGSDCLGQMVLFQVIEKFSANSKRPSCKLNIGFPAALELVVHGVGKQPGHV